MKCTTMKCTTMKCTTMKCTTMKCATMKCTTMLSFLLLAACSAEEVDPHAFALAGEATHCITDDDCAPGRFCEEDGSRDFDSWHVCVEHIATCAGQPCGPDAFCRQDERVHEGGLVEKVFYCAPRLPYLNYCHPTGDKDVSPCEEGMVCRLDVHSGATACLPPAAADDFCNDDDDCGGSLWCDGLSCRPRPAADEPCYSDSACAAGEYCGYPSFKCHPRAPLGGACHGDSSIECLPGLACDLASSTCVDPARS